MFLVGLDSFGMSRQVGKFITWRLRCNTGILPVGKTLVLKTDYFQDYRQDACATNENP